MSCASASTSNPRLGPTSLSVQQIADLREMTGVQHLDVPGSLLVRLLQPGHRFECTSIGPIAGPIDIDEPLADVLGSLPTLTTLNAELHCKDVLFFRQLRELTELVLVRSGWARREEDELVAALQCCTKITRLTLRGQFAFTGQHLEALLPAFPSLSSVDLYALTELESLACFATPSLAASLTSLRLSTLPSCPPIQLTHLFELHSLQSLSIRFLQAAPDAELTAAFRVSSPWFSSLQASFVDEPVLQDD